jgi:uncharacterized Zn finger protein
MMVISTSSATDAGSTTQAGSAAGGITYPRIVARTRSARSTTWWGKAWVRAVEESAYGADELRQSRASARAGTVGGITVEAGSFFAAVDERDEVWSPRIALPLLDADQRTAFVEVIAARTGRVAALLAGSLPFDVIEEAEESGVELLPYGGEFDATCACDTWTQPCVHALAVLHQCTWLIDDDPFVLLHLRGLSRERLLSDLHGRERLEPVDVEVGYDAAVRAQSLLKDFDKPPGLDRREAT